MSCVFAPLERDVGCTRHDVEEVVKRVEVRQGILDVVPTDCGKYTGNFFLYV